MGVDPNTNLWVGALGTPPDRPGRWRPLGHTTDPVTFQPTEKGMTLMPTPEPETLRLEIVSQPAQRITTTLKVLAAIALTITIITNLVVAFLLGTIISQRADLTPLTEPAVTDSPFGEGTY